MHNRYHGEQEGIKHPCELNAKTLMRSVHENPFLVQIGFKEVIKLPGFKISQKMNSL